MRAKLLVLSSLALIAATTYVITQYGGSVYFITFHKPLHFGFTNNTSHLYVPPALPSFWVNQHITATTLYPGEVQHISVSATPNQNVIGYVEVWIESPLNKQVFRSDTNSSPTQFIKDKTANFSYSYTIPSNIPKGLYTASAIITSTNNQTDYYVHTNFATFRVS